MLNKKEKRKIQTYHRKMKNIILIINIKITTTYLQEFNVLTKLEHF